MVVKESIHVIFDENKPEKDLSKLDESFVDLRLDDDSIETSSSRQNLEIKVSIQQEEVRETTICIMRRNHIESQIIRDPTNHVQARASLRTQGHWIEDSKKIGPEMQEKALGFSRALG